MNKTIQLLGITLFGAAALVACGDDSVTGGGPTGGSGDGGTPVVGGGPPEGGNGGNPPEGGNGGAPPMFPPPPEPGAQIDRMGRPAINTALNGAFVQYDGTTPVAANATDRGVLQDGYNEDMTEADWGDTYGPMFIGNLAVIDSLDTGVDLDGPGGNPALTNAQACTNQAGHPTPGDLDDPANYGTLGGLALPDDRIYVNAAAEKCSANAVNSQTDPLNGYLGVEIATLLAMPAGCGGRRPIDDVIAITYSLLTIGLPAGIDDGITARPGQHPETFPYLAGPEQNDP
jgi:hypothetical protein